MRITASPDFIDSSSELLELIAFWYRETMPKEAVREQFNVARDRALRTVSEHPKIGRGGPEGRITSFIFKSRSYLILYSVEGDSIVLRDIADGRSRQAARWRGY